MSLPEEDLDALIKLTASRERIEKTYRETLKGYQVVAEMKMYDLLVAKAKEAAETIGSLMTELNYYKAECEELRSCIEGDTYHQTMAELKRELAEYKSREGSCVPMGDVDAKIAEYEANPPLPKFEFGQDE